VSCLGTGRLDRVRLAVDRDLRQRCGVEAGRRLSVVQAAA